MTYKTIIETCKPKFKWLKEAQKNIYQIKIEKLGKLKKKKKKNLNTKVKHINSCPLY